MREYIKICFVNYYVENGIEMLMMLLETPQQDRVVESMNKTMKEMEKR